MPIQQTQQPRAASKSGYRIERPLVLAGVSDPIPQRRLAQALAHCGIAVPPFAMVPEHGEDRASSVALKKTCCSAKTWVV
jgi:hypothetical protein